jgi:hypothetical protein
MTPEADDDRDELRSTIPINRQLVELIAKSLDDLDIRLRQPLVLQALQETTRRTDLVSADCLVDAVGFQALRLRQILASQEPASEHPATE